MKQAALSYARAGLRVFPCAPNRKVPATRHGVKDASDDDARIEAWWDEMPKANIGIACGASGLVVLDIDRKNGADGWEVVDSMMLESGELPGTRMASTPNRGAHLYYRSDADIRPSCGRFGDGLDIRAGGSYVVAPPSTLDGRAYRWDITETTAELPQRWVEALLPPNREPLPPGGKPTGNVRKYCLIAMQDEAHSVADTPEGQRNEQLWRAAAALGGLVHLGEIDGDDIDTALQWACSRWPKRNARKDRDTIARGLAFGVEHPRAWSEG